MEVEALAMVEAHHVAFNLDIHHVVFKFDCKAINDECKDLVGNWTFDFPT